MDHRPNTELTKDEKNAKRELKKRLKLQHQRMKLETRMKQAVKRGDEALVEQTQGDLQAVARQEEREGVIIEPSTCELDDCEVEQWQETVRRYIEAVYLELQKSWASDDPFHWSEQCYDFPNHYEIRRQKNRGNPQYTDPKTRKQRVAEARVLLQNMTKGTQSIDMFDNTEALRGYTRHKFIERALLVASSFGKLQQYVSSSAERSATDHDDDSSAAIARRMLEQLLKVRSLCSLGCGPGCDAVGVVAFLQSVARPGTESGLVTSITDEVSAKESGRKELQQLPNRARVLDRVVLLDWAMVQWVPIVQTLKDLLVERQQAVRQIEMATCDARTSLFEQYQNKLSENVMREGEANSSTACSTGHISEDVQSLITTLASSEECFSGCSNPSESKEDESLTRCLNVDLIVVSYMLSETRGEWHNLMDDLVKLSVAGTLFMFTDPTAWQLHIFRERYEFCENDNSNDRRQKQMIFLWLDSSMHRPELQVLEGRIGPAVLLAIKL